MQQFFNYQRVAQEAGISGDQLQTIMTGILHDYPHDEMLFELHVLRACRVVADGLATVEDVIGSLPGQSHAA